ncbi:hypothetical protein AKJ09_08801 [Labilithrix luteola]|uniref:Uncharacterized protein n=1 Tax=Labilithrix luteola TaxID=1391654 RepID=A0A0K1Q8S7_9BACT|nr:hypothetical protein [Labilithrix luteola]AKV02138.1 hypothetical protein AKJ09_08801 [Labilithrix luteola]
MSIDATDEPNSGPNSSKGGKANKKKRKSPAEVQEELRQLSKQQGGEERPPVDLKKIYVRVGIVALVIWVIAVILPGWIPKAGAGVLTALGIGVLVWLDRYVKKQMKLGALLKGADTAEGRKDALQAIDSQFKKGDSTAALAKAQLQMQEDPRAALATLEAVNLDKEIGPIAGQIRAMRAMIHLTLGETQEARSLADKLDLGKQQEPKTRVMFAAVASEAWARTGQGRKAVDTLDLFNPEEPDMGELRAQLWRSRAFAYAAVNDTKGIARAVKKLSEINPHLLGMFVGQKKIHPLLEREAKQVVMKMGIVPRKTIRQKM